MRSFRYQLAWRQMAAMAVGLGTIAGLSFLFIRQNLDRELNATLTNVASIQAASVTSAESGEMVFHEWELTPEEAASIRDLNRYAQVWTVDGRSLLRTRYITEDLPLDTVALQAAAAGSIAWTEQAYLGMPIRSVYYPLGRFGPAHGPHVLQVAAPLETRDRTLQRLALLLVGIVLMASAGTFLGGWWLADLAVRPVHAITGQAEAIGAGTLERRISAYADSREYQRLVQVLNTMLARLDAAFEAQRRFTGNASHELRSPLTALRGELELARRRERSPDEYRRVIDSALEEVDRLSRTTEDLLVLARADAGVMQVDRHRIDLAERVRAAATRLTAPAAERSITLTAECDDAVPVQGDAGLLDRLIWNLVENAVKFSPPGGWVRVRTARDDDAGILEVTDSGPGIPAAEAERVFERFYRGDESRTPTRETAGTGLGLSIVRAVADLHGASVSAANAESGGAVFRVRFPATRRNAD